MAQKYYIESKKHYNILKKITMDDLEYPIQDYYGCSSHNTYLVEHAQHKRGINGTLKYALTRTMTRVDQLVGRASEEQYMNVLMEGCRHVELDVYNGKKLDDGYEPIITHGGTLVNYITLSAVLKRITEFAFYKKDFSPIILNIENNCTDKKTSTHITGCQVVSSIIQEVWPKDSGFKPDSCACKDTDSFLMARYQSKILIRDSEKKHYDELESISGLPSFSFSSGSDSRELYSDMDPNTNLKNSGSNLEQQELNELENFTPDVFMNNADNTISGINKSWDDNLGVDAEPSQQTEIDTEPEMCPRHGIDFVRQGSGSGTTENNKAIEISLKKISHSDQAKLDIFGNNCIDFSNELCGCYTKSINFSHLRCNLNIKALKNKKIIDKNRINCFIQKTKTITTRTYPPGIHVASANYDPIICMSLGINYTAINFQMNDRYKAIYMSLFSNSNGYLLKPSHLRSTVHISDAFADLRYKTICIKPSSRSSNKSLRYMSLYTGFLTYSQNGVIRSKPFSDKSHIKMNICEKEICLSVIYICDQNNYVCLPLNQLTFDTREQTIRLRMMSHRPRNISYDDLTDLNMDQNHDVYPKVSDDFKYYYLKHIVADKYVDVTISIESL